MEIERKFRVIKIPQEIEKFEKKDIEQGYLCIKPTVRIRKTNNEYTLNYKWKNKNVVEKKAIQNIEYEIPLKKENLELNYKTNLSFSFYTYDKNQIIWYNLLK